MSIDLAFTPAGRLMAVESTGEENGLSEGSSDAAGPGIGKMVKAFTSSQAAGLFALATVRFEEPLTPSVAYWRDFVGRYLTELCHTPEAADTAISAITPPSPEERATLLLSVPPMPGAEYLTDGALTAIWLELDSWVRDQIASSKQCLSRFLKHRAPLWHQVGRVCFHLAENRRDPDYPFAFLATYAPSLKSGARVHYQPLSKALQEYAGAKNKQGLVKLLSPVHRASENSSFVRELVESGDIYQALAWTPREAYEFLTDAPLLEESGVLVRLPDWWKKRPRPQVGITIGEQRQKKFDVKGMLDFKVQVALGDQPLTEAEWRKLLAAEQGLVLLRGQWVEVDGDKLTKALDHWKNVEEQAEDGLSFIEGMRLLAGAPRDLAAAGDGGEAQREWSLIHAGN